MTLINCFELPDPKPLPDLKALCCGFVPNLLPGTTTLAAT